MRGKPKFKQGDVVTFAIGEREVNGVVFTVDEFGTFFDRSDVCYDIFSEEENMLYKHVNEKFVIKEEQK